MEFLQKMHAKYAIVLHSIVQLYEQYKIQTTKICVNLSWTGDRIKLKELSSVIKRKDFPAGGIQEFKLAFKHFFLDLGFWEYNIGFPAYA